MLASGAMSGHQTGGCHGCKTPIGSGSRHSKLRHCTRLGRDAHTHSGLDKPADPDEVEQRRTVAAPEVHAVALQLARTVLLAASIRGLQLRSYVRQNAARAA